MKTYVSYVIQEEKNHVHKAEVVTTQNPPYSYSSDTQVSSILEWVEEKKKGLKQNQDLVITSMYKL